MKAIVSIVTVLVLVSQAQAARQLGNKQSHKAYQCGLTSSMETDDIIKVGKSKEIKPGAQFNDLEKQQIVIAAREMYGDQEEITGTTQAAALLVSAGYEAYISHFRVGNNETLFTQIIHYPGDNPVGVIFLKGTTKVVAYNNDGSTECK